MTRELAGRALADAVEIVHVNGAWLVPSQSDPDVVYRVTSEDGELRCTCEDFRGRGGICKHMIAAGVAAARERRTPVCAA